VTCHTPHAADMPGLVIGNGRDICLSCHKSIQATIQKSFSIHPKTGAAGRCTACHTPHQSDEPHLLKAAKNAVCQSCHKTHSQFGHPMGTGVIDPRDGTEVSCLSCHLPHGSQQQFMLIANPKRDLCVMCHPSEGPSLRTPHGQTGTLPPLP